MQFLQTHHREQRRNDRNEKGKDCVADQNDSYALRIANIANRAGNRFKETLQRKFRDPGPPPCNTYKHRKKTKRVERENGVSSDDKQKQSPQSWTHNRRDVQLQPAPG